MLGIISALCVQYFWLIIMLLALLLEALTVALVSIWFALGALLAWLAQLAGCSWLLQVLLFVLVSLVTILFTFKYKPLRMQIFRQVRPTNYDALINQKAIVIKTVNDSSCMSVGQIKVNQQVWSAYVSDLDEEGTSYPVGTKVKIVKILGVHAYVTSVE